MSFEIAAQQKPQSSGAMAIATSRQSADSQTQMIAAKHYPRDEDAALARILKACGRKALAEAAVYSYKKGDSVVEGASIRLAEVLAQSWGNMNCGFTVLESNELESQVMAFAWDLETNTQKALTFPVAHIRVSGRGERRQVTTLTDPRDIYETVANAAARRVRACILALIPGDIQDAALEACAVTMRQVTGKELPERIVDMVAKFDQMGITETMLEARLQTPRAAWTAQQVVQMGKLFLSLRDGFVKQADIPEFADPDIVPVAKSKEVAKTEPEPKQETQPVATEGKMTNESWKADWNAEATRVGHSTGNPHQVILFATRMRDAATCDELDGILGEAKTACGKEKHQISGRQISKIEEYAEFRAEQIVGS